MGDQEAEAGKMAVQGKSGKLGAHDIGGLEAEYGAIDRTEKGFHLWEMQASFFLELTLILPE